MGGKRSCRLLDLKWSIVILLLFSVSTIFHLTPRNPCDCIPCTGLKETEVSDTEKPKDLIPCTGLKETEVPDTEKPKDLLPRNYELQNEVPYTAKDGDFLPRNYELQNEVPYTAKDGDLLPRNYELQYEVPYTAKDGDLLPRNYELQNEVPYTAKDGDLLSRNYELQNEVPYTAKDGDLKCEKQNSVTNETYKTWSEELKCRRRLGYFDGIPLRYLLQFTRIVRKPELKCPENGFPVVILIKSSCDHAARRNKIRETWGRNATDLSIPVFFFVGVGNCSVTAENDQHKDIVELDLLDSYFNVTFKTLARLRFYLKYCPNANYVHLLDDDVFVNVQLVLDYIANDTNVPSHSAFGSLMRRSPVLREYNSPWYVPLWVLEYEFYPEYFSGASILLDGKVIDSLYEASLDAPFITVDDALIIGIAGKMISLKMFSDVRLLTYARPGKNISITSSLGVYLL